MATPVASGSYSSGADRAPARVPRAVREREMVAAARGAFAERGYHGVSMEEIAERAGISKPMLYAYFDSKEGLFAACVDDATGELMDDLSAAAGGERTPEMRLWRGFLAVFDFADQNRDSWILLFPRGPASGGPFAGAAEVASEAMADLLVRLLTDSAVEQGIDAEVARKGSEPMARAIVAATEGMVTWWLRNPAEPKELQAMRLMNLVWTGLGDVVAGRLWTPPVEAAGEQP